MVLKIAPLTNDYQNCIKGVLRDLGQGADHTTLETLYTLRQLWVFFLHVLQSSVIQYTF